MDHLPADNQGPLISRPVVEPMNRILSHQHRLASGLLTGRSLVREDGTHFHLLPDGTLTPPSLAPEGMAHNHGGGMTDPIDVVERSGFNKIKGVEIFSVGTWNEDKFTREDLLGMVDAFNENAEGFRPFMKLGHDPKQLLLKQDGLPSAGWVERLYVIGDKLFADLFDVPKKIFELIQKKAYRKVSSEIYFNVHIKEKFYKRMLGAIAFLGASNPGVMNLSDILSNYNLKDYEEIKSYEIKPFDSKIYEIISPEDIMPKTEREINLENDLKNSQAKNKDLESKVSKYSTDETGKDKEITDLKQYKIDSEKRISAAEASEKQTQLESFAKELKSEKLLSPAMEPHLFAFMGEEKKEYTINKKNLTKQEMMKEFLKLFKSASEVNFKEGSEEGKIKTKANSDEANEKLIQTFMKENKCDYSTAYRSVSAELSNQGSAEGEGEGDE